MVFPLRAFILPLAVLTYAAIALAIAPGTYIDMVEFYLRQATILPVLLGIGLPLAAIFLRPRAPMQMVLEVLRRSGLRFLVVSCVFCIGIAGFTTFKLAIPRFVPFYADPFLASADAWLHHGNPGDWAHALVPSWAQYPLGYLYGPVWFMLWFGLLTMVSLHADAKLRFRYFWTMALAVCLLGTVAATAFSSVGPVFYGHFIDPDRFATLMASIKASAIGDYMQQASGYLLDSYLTGAGKAGTGISAMPSMHLAIATLNACMLLRINRFLGALACVYVGAILLGSVYLGWHYALDGYVSIASVSLLWFAMGRVTRRLAVTDTPPLQATPAGAPAAMAP